MKEGHRRRKRHKRPHAGVCHATRLDTAPRLCLINAESGLRASPYTFVHGQRILNLPRVTFLRKARAQTLQPVRTLFSGVLPLVKRTGV